jgi:excisionase family DNA binding protein
MGRVQNRLVKKSPATDHVKEHMKTNKKTNTTLEKTSEHEYKTAEGDPTEIKAPVKAKVIKVSTAPSTTTKRPQMTVVSRRTSMDTSRKKAEALASSVQLDEAIRLLRVMQATPDVLEKIDQILDGKESGVVLKLEAPPLLSVTTAAQILGVGRQTVYRMIDIGRLPRIEISPGIYRIQRKDLEIILAGKVVTQ